MSGKIIDAKKHFDNKRLSEINTADTNNVIGKNEPYWQCNCGSVLFFLTPSGAKCRGCGCFSSWANDL